MPKNCFFLELFVDLAKLCKSLQHQLIKIVPLLFQLMSEKDMKKLRTREAYMSLYY